MVQKVKAKKEDGFTTVTLEEVTPEQLKQEDFIEWIKTVNQTLYLMANEIAALQQEVQDLKDSNTMTVVD